MKTKLFNLFKVPATIAVLFFSFSAIGQTNDWLVPKEADKIANPFQNDLTAIKKGKKIYDQMCWTCHGEFGKGDGPAGKTLNPKPANHTGDAVQSQTDGAIYWKLSNGKGVMPAYGKVFTKTERWQLVSYIRELGGKNKTN